MTVCDCTETHVPRRIVLTGGPGAGKTAALELIRRASFCEHVQILPEAAGIVFGGGFPRTRHVAARKAAQRAIFHVQRELEEAARAENAAVTLCDRGTVDGAAYWPGPDDYFAGVGTTLAEELRRYDTVIHLRTPPLGNYNHHNRLLDEVEMRLVSAPKAPSPSLFVTLAAPRVPDVWQPYLTAFGTSTSTAAA